MRGIFKERFEKFDVRGFRNLNEDIMNTFSFSRVNAEIEQKKPHHCKR